MTYIHPVQPVPPRPSKWNIVKWVLHRRRYGPLWSPFADDGSVDWPRLKNEGWVQVGALREDSDESI